jgi:alkaline phosphatase D
MYDRRLKDLVRYANGEKIADFHIPTTVDDYRALYRAYLADPDLQDARARWPFVCVWDNHEFSWKGWQSQQVFGRSRPAQTRKAAANQAWFEYQPARVVMPGTRSLDRFASPRVADAPIERFDSSGLGLEPGNLAAIESLRIHRTLRFGRNADLLLTDNRSFRSEPLTDRPETQPFKPTGFPFAVSQDIVAVLDGGRSYRDGNPPATIRFDGQDLPNPRRDSPPQSMLGAAQKAWFLDRLERSDARWKLWGNSVAMLDWRIDWHRLPDDFGLKWPTTGYALLGDEDWSGYRAERAEIFDRIKRKGITGFASVAGDRHSFLAGLISPTLPPDRFEPVGVEFVTGSVSAPGLVEVAEHSIPKTSPLHPVLVGPGRVNTTLLQGVRSTLALARTGDANQARAARNPELAPHLVFADLGGHGYTMIRATPDALEAELVSIPRPIERSQQPDGGPLAYRVRLRAPLWSQGGTPRLDRELIEGTLPFLE